MFRKRSWRGSVRFPQNLWISGRLYNPPRIRILWENMWDYLIPRLSTCSAWFVAITSNSETIVNHIARSNKSVLYFIKAEAHRSKLLHCIYFKNLILPLFFISMSFRLKYCAQYKTYSYTFVYCFMVLTWKIFDLRKRTILAYLAQELFFLILLTIKLL